MDSAKGQAKIVQANPQKSAKTVQMAPPQIKRLPSNNELLRHLFPIFNNSVRCIRQCVSILHFSLLDFQDSNLALLPSTWQLSPAVEPRFQHKITLVVCQFQLLQRSPEVSETTEKAKGLHLLSQRMMKWAFFGEFLNPSHLLWLGNFE